MRHTLDVAVVIIMASVCLANSIPANNLNNLSGISLIHIGNHNIYNMFWKVSDNDNDSCLFIVEAELDKNGRVQDHGLYTLHDFKVKKVRDSGRDGVMATDGSNLMLVGAKDGVYRCNCSYCEQERYGSINDSIIGIVMERKTEKIYVLNEEKKLYAITDQGNKINTDDRVQNAQQIMIDCNDNLYYYGFDKQLYLINNKETRKINGIPANPISLMLVRPILVKSATDKETVMAVAIDNKIYDILPDASSELSKLPLPELNFTLINIENSLIIFFAKEKEVYTFSPIPLMIKALVETYVKFINEANSNKYINSVP